MICVHEAGRGSSREHIHEAGCRVELVTGQGLCQFPLPWPALRRDILGASDPGTRLLMTVMGMVVVTVVMMMLMEMMLVVMVVMRPVWVQRAPS